MQQSAVCQILSTLKVLVNHSLVIRTKQASQNERITILLQFQKARKLYNQKISIYLISPEEIKRSTLIQHDLYRNFILIACGTLTLRGNLKHLLWLHDSEKSKLTGKHSFQMAAQKTKMCNYSF
jgi:hypothetical protein